MMRAGGSIYVFPRFTLASGASVKVFLGKGSNDAAKLYAGRVSPVWNNNGDTAVLRDAGGNVVSQRRG